MSSKHLTFDIRNLSFQSLLIILVLVLIPIVVLLRIRQTAVSVSAAWFNDSWQYRQAINVSSHTPAESNVYIIATVNISDTSHALTNDTDFRFTTTNGQLLPYYISSGVGTTSITFHIQLPFFPAGAQTFYAYYGNPSATSGASLSDFSTPASNYTIGGYGTEEVGGGPVAYWKFDEGVGTSVFDSTGNKNNGYFVGATLPSWATEDACISNKCLYSSGSGYITVPSSSKINFGTNSFSVSFWGKAQDFTYPRTFFSMAKQTAWLGNDGAIGWAIDGYNSNGTSFEMNDGTNKIRTNLDFNIGSRPTDNLNKWVYVTYVFDRTQNRFYAYINGVKQSNSVDISSITGSISNNNAFTFGNGTGWLVKGYLDDVKIYPYARTLAQIQQDYTAGKAHAAAAKGVETNLGSNAKNADALSNGLVGYWKMDEGVGTSTTDYSGNGHFLTATGTGASFTPGKFGSAEGMNGTDYLTNYSCGNAMSNNEITWATWVWIDSSAIDKRAILRSDSFHLSTDSNSHYIYYIHDSSVGWLSWTSKASITTNNWQHLVLTYSNRAIKLYINGILDSANTYSAGSGLPASSDASCLIGYAGGWNNFVGKEDEIRVYNRALSPAEVSQLYNYAPGPVGYWKFDEGIGTSFADSSGNNLKGSFAAGTLAPSWVNGKYTKALNFSSSTQYATVNTGGTSPIEITGNLTAEAWVNWHSFRGTTGIISKSNQGQTNNMNYGLWAYSTYIAGMAGNGTNAQQVATTTLPSLNTWHHLTLSIDGSYLRLYIDGALVGTTVQTITPTANSYPLYISMPSGLAIDGLIDEVKIYNYARTQKQIVEDMTGGAPAVTNKSMLGYWKFDEGSGSIANNSGNGGIGLTGAFLGQGGSRPSWTDGKFGKAVSGDKNVYVRVNDTNNAFDSPTFSISTWVNVGTTNATETLFFARENYNTSGFRLGLGTGAGSAYKAQFWTTESGGNISLTSSKALNDGNWHHLVFLYDGTMASIYTDGTKTGSIAGTYVVPTTYSFIIKGMATSYIGANASMDEVKYYNYALTDQEVALDYNRGVASQMGSLSSGSGNTSPATAGSQEYCLPGDTAACNPPVARWDFEEGSGATAFDTSGNGNNAAFGTGTSAPIWVNSKSGFGKALSFDGVKTYLNSGKNSQLDLDYNQPFTISFLAKPTDFNTYRTFISKRDGGYKGYWFGYHSGSGYIVWTQINISSSNRRVIYWNAPPINQWTYFELTSDGVNAAGVKLYYNGILQTPANTIDTLSASTINTINVNIGQDTFSSGASYNGLLDQIKIFNYARTPAQIAWDYNKGGPVGWWKFDDCQGGIVYNSAADPATAGLGSTGAINIGASGTQTSLGTCSIGTSAAWTAGASGKFNSSLNFDGIDDYVQVNLGTTLTQGSFSFWLKPSINTGSNRRIISKSWGNDEIYISGSDSKLKTTGSLVVGDDIISTSAIPINQWIHVVLTADTTGSKLYLNSVLNDTGSAASFSISSFKIGGQYTASWESFGGQIDDVRIYNYALTANQVSTLYNGGAVNFR